MTDSDPESGRILIAGVGNELLTDEGLGVHVVRLLRGGKTPLPVNVDLVEAGTALFDLLPDLAGYTRVIIVDAMQAGGKPGTVYRMEPDDLLTDAHGGGPPVSLHEFGVMATLRAAASLGFLRGSVLLVGAEPESLEPGTELSPKLARAARRIASSLVREVTPAAERGSGTAPRSRSPHSGR